MTRKNNFTHYAWFPFFLWDIPCYYDEVSDNIAGRNWFYDLLLDFAVWKQFEFDEQFSYKLGERIKK